MIPVARVCRKTPAKRPTAWLSCLGSELKVGRRWFIAGSAANDPSGSSSTGTTGITNKESAAGVQSSAVTNLSIGTRQQLYMIHSVTPGSVFFLPHGTRIFNTLIKFMRAQQQWYGFEEVVSPIIYKSQLWKKSGHWDNYKEDMFKVSGFQSNDIDTAETEAKAQASTGNCTDTHSHEEEEYGLKPMNCPGHCLMYSRFDRSHNELPIRYSDFSPLHRNEASGALSGLTRVRRFHQDDGHIFCTKEQVYSEMRATLQMLDTVYNTFGLGEYRMVLSTRPDSYIGFLEDWNDAEKALRDVLDDSGKNWEVNEGDGAFYGPKIDVLLKDNTGKEHQVGTVQLDFQLPTRFELQYRSGEVKDGSVEMRRPVMIHRAIYGSLERFMAILIDHYQGHWPFWLSPRQAVVIPVAERHQEHARKVAVYLSGKANVESFEELTDEILQKVPFSHSIKEVAEVEVNGNSAGNVSPVPLNSHIYYVDVDARAETLGARMKDCLSKGYTYVIVIGDKEVADSTHTIAVKHRQAKRPESMTVDAARDMFIRLEREYQ